MPFTFSHPALVLPLRYLPKKWFSFTGLVVGSMMPDFEYFLRMKIKSIHGHTWGGMLWFDLPLALCFAFIFHNIVRNNLLLNLPFFLQSRLATFITFNWNMYCKSNWPVVVISVLTGSASHIFWDGFTHEHGYFVEHIQDLRKTIVVANTLIPLWKIIQHASTLTGALIIAWAIYSLPQNKSLYKKPDKKYWTMVAAISIGIVIIRLLAGVNPADYGTVIATGIAAIMAALMLTPLLLPPANNVS